MTPNLAILIVLSYFVLLWLVSLATSRNAGADTFFTADKRSNWILVAFGMIGVALSGLTFISVPGDVGNSQFTYFQLVIGYTAGIFVIARVLLPLYYRLKLVSIYAYLNQRFGRISHKTGAVFFLIAQTVTSAFKLFLMTTVLQLAFFDSYGIPFEVSVFVTLLLIWLYTYRAGIKTIVITDALQTTFLIGAAVSTVIVIVNKLDFSFGELLINMHEDPRSKIFVWEWSSDRQFFKLFFTGMFLTIITNGLDQSVMQKHLTCPTIRDAKKNMYWFGSSLLVVNTIFLGLGLLLYMYASQLGIEIPEQTDEFYPLMAIKHLGTFTGIVFLIGIAAAAYSSADSALAGLTTSFCIDLMDMGKDGKPVSRKRRTLIHLGFVFLVFLVIVVFHSFNNDSLINTFIRVSGYTYGPILGLFAFGIFSKRQVSDALVPFIAVLSPIISLLLYFYSERLFGYKFGFEILLINGGMMVFGLWVSSWKITKHINSKRKNNE